MTSEKTKLDRMIYVKDNVPSLCAIVAIVCNVFYFVLIYQVNKEYFYNALMGISVITNLLFMLFAFLCSEEVKNYHSQYAYVMFGLAAVEIVRIFIYPMRALNTLITVDDQLVSVLSSGQFVRCLVLLGAAAAFLIVGGVISIRNANTLKKYRESLTK